MYATSKPAIWILAGASISRSIGQKPTGGKASTFSSALSRQGAEATGQAASIDVGVVGRQFQRVGEIHMERLWSN
jgi:hypothetical protein